MDTESYESDAQRPKSSLTSRIARLAARQHNVVAQRQLLEMPMGARRILRWVEAARLHEIFTRAYAVGTARVTELGRIMAAVLACGPDSFASHRTAARLWALGIERQGFEVTVGRSNAPKVKGIKTRKSTFGPGETTTRHGIPVTSLYRTLIDLAAVLDENALAYALDQAGRHNISIPRLREAIARHKGKKGIAKLRRVVDEYHPTNPVKSPLEWDGRNFCRREKLPPAEVNALIETTDGFREGDLTWPKPDQKVILEIQSKEHHGSWQARIRDNRRAAELQADGWLVLQATKDDLRPGKHSRELGARLRRILEQRRSI
jgi:hypothetical protein